MDVQIDVEVDPAAQTKDADVTQTAAQELSSAPPAPHKGPDGIKLEPGLSERPERPNTANSFSSGTSADSIPPLPPLPVNSTHMPMRPGVISSIGENRFSAHFLASSSSKPENNLASVPGRLLTNTKHKTLTRAHSDSQAVYFKNNGILSSDRDSQLGCPQKI